MRVPSCSNSSVSIPACAHHPTTTHAPPHTQVLCILSTVFFLYLSSKAIETFDCTVQPDGLTRRLDASPGIMCSSTDKPLMIWLIAVCVLLFALPPLIAVGTEQWCWKYCCGCVWALAALITMIMTAVNGWSYPLLLGMGVAVFVCLVSAPLHRLKLLTSVPEKDRCMELYAQDSPIRQTYGCLYDQ